MPQSTYKYKVEIDQQSLRQQMMQMHQAVQVSSQMASPSMTRNIMGIGGAAALGMNTIMQDLQSTMSMLPQPQLANFGTSGSMVNMTLGQGLMGAAGFGAPNTMRMAEYQRMSQMDLGYRASAAFSQGTLGVAKSALDWGPAMLAGGISGGVAAAGGAGTAGTLGAAAWGGLTLGASSLAMFGGITAGVYAGGKFLNSVQDKVKNRYRSENILFAASGGRMNQQSRSRVASGIAGMVADEPNFSAQEGTELLAYGTESELLDARQNSDEYQRNYKTLLKSVKTIMSTMHQSVQEAVTTMRDMKSSGILDSDDFGTTAIMLKSRAALAGMSTGRMQRVGLAGARTGARYNIGAETGMRTATFGAAAGGRLFTEQELQRQTGTTGKAALELMGSSLTTGMAQFASSNAGLSYSLGLIDTDTGRIDTDKLRKLNAGELSMNEVINEGTRVVYDLKPSAARRMARRAYENMPGQLVPTMAAVMARSIATGKADMDPTSESDLAEAVRSMGVTDETTQQFIAKLALNPKIIEDIDTANLKEKIRDSQEKAKRDRSIVNRAKKMWHGQGEAAASEVMGVGGTAKHFITQTAADLGYSDEKGLNITGRMRPGDRISLEPGNIETFEAELNEYVGLESGPTFRGGSFEALTLGSVVRNRNKREQWQGLVRKNLGNIISYSENRDAKSLAAIGATDDPMARSLKDYMINADLGSMGSRAHNMLMQDNLGRIRESSQQIYESMSSQEQNEFYGLTMRGAAQADSLSTAGLSRLRGMIGSRKVKTNEEDIMLETLFKILGSGDSDMSPEARSAVNVKNKLMGQGIGKMGEVIGLLGRIEKKMR